MSIHKQQADVPDLSPTSPTENEGLFRALVEHSTDAIALLDSEANFLYISPSVQSILGYLPEDLVGRNGFGLAPVEEQANLMEQFAIAASNPAQTLTVGHHYYHKDGSLLLVESTITNWLHEPDIKAIVSNFHDISARKETEALLARELEQREEEHYRFEAIVESSNDAIVGKTLDGVITSWNQAAERLFGYSAGEAIGKHITLIIPPELYQEEADIISKLRRGEPIRHYETVRVRKDGSRVDLSLSISPIKNRWGKIIGASKIARDITEQKELERRKDAFISMASHELKTPVTSLKGFTQVLARRYKRQNDEEGHRIVSRLDSQLNKLTSLINDLLDISKMQAGELEYREEPFELGTLMQEIVEQVQEISPKHRLLLESLEQVHVFGDRDRIGQVIMNLLTNAIKYSPIADRVIIRVRADPQNDMAVVSVQDFGIGITEDQQQHIFERFYRVKGAMEQTFPGLGIGLHISNEIIKRHRGTIQVQSRKGIGSTFSFTLPLVKNESPEKSK
jgi:PAS domain S-box-containing protein